MQDGSSATVDSTQSTDDVFSGTETSTTTLTSALFNPVQFTCSVRLQCSKTTFACKNQEHRETVSDRRCIVHN